MKFNDKVQTLKYIYDNNLVAGYEAKYIGIHFAKMHGVTEAGWYVVNKLSGKVV
jgi:hypothetical protein